MKISKQIISRNIVVLIALIMAVSLATAGAAGIASASDTERGHTEIYDTNGPVTAGETLEVDVIFKWYGTQEPTSVVKPQWKNIDVERVDQRHSDVAFADVDTSYVSEGSYQRAGRPFNYIVKRYTWDTEGYQSGQYPIKIEGIWGDSGDSVFSAKGTVSIVEPNFDVEISDTNAPITAGEELRVSATITNNGGADGTQEVSLIDADGNSVDQKTVSVSAGHDKTADFSWGTSSSDSGSNEITIQSDDDTATEEVQLNEPSNSDGEATSTDEDSGDPWCWW